MNHHTAMIESQLKAQIYQEQAADMRQRLDAAAGAGAPSFFRAAGQFLNACQAGWAAFHHSLRTTRPTAASR